MTPSSERFAALVGILERFDPARIRVLVHASLPKAADREAFDAATADAQHRALVEAGARAVVRAELVASFTAAAAERISLVRPLARTLPRQDEGEQATG